MTRTTSRAIAEPVFQQRLLKLSRLLRFRQLRLQMVAQVLLILPRLIAERTLRTLHQLKTFFDKRPPLQGRKQGWIGLQPG